MHMFVTSFKQKILAGFDSHQGKGQSKDRIEISQRKYAMDLLEETCLMNGFCEM